MKKSLGRNICSLAFVSVLFVWGLSAYDARMVVNLNKNPLDLMFLIIRTNTAASYFSIYAALVYFVFRRKETGGNTALVRRRFFISAFYHDLKVNLLTFLILYLTAFALVGLIGLAYLHFPGNDGLITDMALDHAIFSQLIKPYESAFIGLIAMVSSALLFFIMITYHMTILTHRFKRETAMGLFGFFLILDQVITWVSPEGSLLRAFFPSSLYTIDVAFLESGTVYGVGTLLVQLVMAFMVFRSMVRHFGRSQKASFSFKFPVLLRPLLDQRLWLVIILSLVINAFLHLGGLDIGTKDIPIDLYNVLDHDSGVIQIIVTMLVRLILLLLIAIKVLPSKSGSQNFVCIRYRKTGSYWTDILKTSFLLVSVYSLLYGLVGLVFHGLVSLDLNAAEWTFHRQAIEPSLHVAYSNRSPLFMHTLGWIMFEIEMMTWLHILFLTTSITANSLTGFLLMILFMMAGAFMSNFPISLLAAGGLENLALSLPLWHSALTRAGLMLVASLAIQVWIGKWGKSRLMGIL